MTPNNLTPQAVVGDMVKALYPELKQVARHSKFRVAHDETMNTTALVNECYLKLDRLRANTIEGRAHFLNLAGRIMRQIACDYAREQLAEKRGGGKRPCDVDNVEIAHERDLATMIELERLLKELEHIDANQARVFEYRFFVGLSEAETSQLLGRSVRSVQRDWSEARAWLAERLRD